jgi:hypothetical protein
MTSYENDMKSFGSSHKMIQKAASPEKNQFSPSLVFHRMHFAMGFVHFESNFNSEKYEFIVNLEFEADMPLT